MFPQKNIMIPQSVIIVPIHMSYAQSGKSKFYYPEIAILSQDTSLRIAAYVVRNLA